MSQIKVELLGHWGSDREIAEAAWVSTKTDKRSDEDVKRVIGMLADHKHGVPFEAVYFRWWLRVPRYIETQLVKHRMSSINGASGRYRRVATNWLHAGDELEALLGADAVADYEELCRQSNECYVGMMTRAKAKYGIQDPRYKRVKEFVRGVLPQAQMTELNVTMNLRAFANFYKQRSALDAQQEIQEAASGMIDTLVAAEVAPIAVAALERNGWVI